MSRHQRPASSSTTRSRIVLGSAMTAVFLSGGAGVAMADQQGSGNTDLDAKSSNRHGGGILPGVLSNNAGQILSGNAALNHVLNGNEINILTPRDRDDDERHGDRKHEGKHENKKHWDGHKWADRDDCECEDDKPQHRHDDDCDDGPQRWHGDDQDDEDDDEADEAKNEKDDEKAEDKDDTKADEKDDTKADEKDDTKAEDKDEVEAAKSDDSTPKVETVATETTDTAPSSDTTPVGAADTGDGSFVPVAPVASSWSMADTMFAAGGGLGAAALLAGAGVGVGRHRRASHRASV